MYTPNPRRMRSSDMNSSSSSSYAPDLPDAVIHLITSSLNLKQAAQTSILSKSWNSGWLTRPILDLDEPYFPKHYRRHFNLMRFGNKTLPRYEESNQPIHTFRLRLESQWYDTYDLAAEWTSKAMKMGPTDVTIRLKHDTIHIPIDEVLASKNLAKLYLQNVRIDIGQPQVTLIECSGLKSLVLIEVRVSIDSFCNVLSCCPSIETLSLYNFKFSVDEECVVGSDPMSSISLGKLTCLVLSDLDSDQLRTFFLRDLSSKFPNLKDLTISIDCYNFKAQPVHVISSRSLEILKFTVGESCQLERVELDLPSIREFTFEGHRMHNMCFKPTSGDEEWDSNVSITHADLPHTNWFRQLSGFLTNLNESKIHLALHLRGSTYRSHHKAEVIRDLNAGEVEDLTIYTKEGLGHETFNSLLEGLFQVCRPKMVTHCVNGKTKSNDLLLCRALKLGMTFVMKDLPIKKRKGKKTVRVKLRSELLFGLSDLKEVHAEELQDEVWVPQTMDSILDDSTSKQRILRFQLKWKP